MKNFLQLEVIFGGHGCCGDDNSPEGEGMELCLPDEDTEDLVPCGRSKPRSSSGTILVVKPIFNISVNK